MVDAVVKPPAGPVGPIGATLHTGDRAVPGPIEGPAGPVGPIGEEPAWRPNVFRAYRIFANAIGHTLPNEINRARAATSAMRRAVQ